MKKRNLNWSLLVLATIILSCTKSSIELPEVKTSALKSSLSLNYRGSKFCDFQLERFNYRDSNLVTIKVKNINDSELDSVSAQMYYFRSNSQAFDSVVFIPKLKALIKSLLKNQDSLTTYLNTAMPENSGFMRAEILYHKKTDQGTKYNLIAGNYSGYAFETSSNQAFSQSKCIINAEGRVTIWIKASANTNIIEAFLPKDTTSLLSIIMKDKENIPITQFNLDTISKNKHFEIKDNFLKFRIKNSDASSPLKNILFNLYKTF